MSLPATHLERMQLFNEADLYVVITKKFCAPKTPLEVLEGAMRAGVSLVQLREKSLSTKEYLELACVFRKITNKFNSLLIIDDSVDIALASGADGVHLGQTDLPIDAARRIAPELIIGGSSHNLDEALEIEQKGASYVNIGPIFATQTKDVPTGVVGPAMIDAITPHISIPWTAMGGIKAHNVGVVIERGGRHPAVVTAVTGSENPEMAARELRELIT